MSFHFITSILVICILQIVLPAVLVGFRIMQTPFMRQSMNLEVKQTKQIKTFQSQPQTSAPHGSASFNNQHVNVTKQQNVITSTR